MRRFLLGFAVGLAVIPVTVFLAGWLGFLPSDAKATPPAWETSFGQMALNAYVARHAPQVTNPLQPTDDNLRAGMNVFLNACAGCHDSGYGDTMYPRAPKFASAAPQLPDWQLFWLVNNGVRYSGMSTWDSAWHHDKAISDDRIWKAVTFLSHIGTLPRAVKAEWDKRPGH